MQNISYYICCFGFLKPATDSARPELLGVYQFLILDALASGGFSACPTYSADVLTCEGRTLIQYDWGDVPSPYAGRALDLHRAAAARIRQVAAALDSARVFFINDASKLQEGEESAIAARLRELLATAPKMASGRLNPRAPTSSP